MVTNEVSEIDFQKIDLKVGLEIHQQLNTNSKLFCFCKPIESDEYTYKFSRKLRASKSEMGKIDPAALFESKKSKTMEYYGNKESSCLVEQDEEPPHELDSEAKKIALTIASSLKSSIFTEIFPMRKIVIDGSNTSGFQRTMLVSQGGNIDVDGRRVGVQSICLEEDAAKIIGDDEQLKKYSLDRLGIPLVEIALDPVSAPPAEMKKIALSLGRLLRATKKVRRGLGTIRQDVNVSIMGNGVVEVKGVQQLDQLEKVVEFEAKRQLGLIKIAEKIKEQKISFEKIESTDVTDVFKTCDSKIIQKAIKNNSIIKAIKIENFHGLFGFEPFPEIRLGKEIGQLVKFFGIGGVFHSDELPNYGIEEKDIISLREFLKLNENDGFLLLAADKTRIDFVINAIINRIKEAEKGIPPETRLATQNGETVFLRPRPGASRLYPETDIPPILVTKEELEIAEKNIPKPWDESIKDLQTKFDMNRQLSEQIFDSEYLELFEQICKDKKQSPNFVASTLCSTITNLERKGHNSTLLKNEHIMEIFSNLSMEKIPKESIEIIFEQIMTGQSNTVEEAISKLAISSLDEKEVNRILDEIVEKNSKIIANQGERSIGPLMGIAMKTLRGKASGELINRLLIEKIKFLNKN